MTLKKTLAFILATSMLTASLAACGDDTDKETNAPETNAPETKAPTNDETEFDRTSIADNLPEITFNGQSFRILTSEGNISAGSRNAEGQYIYDDELVGDAMNDAIRKRNIDVETRFDVKIATHSTGVQEAQDVMMQYAQAEMDEYDVADLMQYMSWVPLVYGLSMDWNNIPYIDLSKPWWNKQSNDQATINGKIYRLTGDLSLTSLQYCWALGFNMELLNDWGYKSEDLYQLVFDGEWTIDKMIEITAPIYLDTDKDNVPSVGDTYGYSTWTSAGTDPWLLAIDARIMDKDAEGNLQVTLGTEKVYNTLEKLCNYIYNNEGVFHYANDDPHPDFKDGKIGMTTVMLSDCSNEFTDLSFNYGILPFPKYDTAQAGYVTTGMDQLSVYNLPINTPEDRYEFIGIMMEVLNAESYKTVYPAYFDGALKGRYSTDANMAEVMDIIVEGRRFDLAYLYGIYINRLPYQFRYCIRDNSTDLASKLAENKASIDDALDLLTEFYQTGEAIWY